MALVVDSPFSQDSIFLSTIWKSDASKRDISVTPLSKPFCNQPFGFYLTINSPLLSIQLTNNIEEDDTCNHIYPNFLYTSKWLDNYVVNMDLSKDTIEPYEIGFYNIAEIQVFDDYGLNVA
jgi:hypothetical protein